MSRVVSYLHNSNNSINLGKTEEECFVCVIDNIVVGNIIKFKMSLDLDNKFVPVLLPDWQIFLKILQSPDHQFIKSEINILPGTFWNGEEFVVSNEQNEQNEPEILENNTEYDVYKKINNSYIYYENSFGDCVKDYNMYIIDILSEYLNNNPLLEINMVINSKKIMTFDNNNKIIHVYFNIEQTIIDDSMITLTKEPDSKILFNNKQYTVYVDMIKQFEDYDIIFDYSKPNIKNIEISGLYPEILPKYNYVSACVYKNVIMTPISKTVNTLTLFRNISSLRREKKLKEINNLLVNHRNEDNCFGDELKTLLENTKILINIHRSDYENTFEEIRVLPALQQKVLVVSEISPLTELVPFNPLIIWATYDNIIEKTKEVLENYEEYFNKIFTNENINLLNNLNDLNKINIFSMLQ